MNEISNIFNNDLHPQLRDHLNDRRSSIRPPRHYRGPREPRNALRCYMVGLTQDHASPHVAILCKEKWFRTQARHIILESGFLQDRGWGGCIKLPYEIRQNGATSLAPKSPADDPPFQKSAFSRRNQHIVAISYYPGSTSGLRIAICGLSGCVSMATIGGAIEIDGTLFGLSVSHVFSAEISSYDETGSESESEIKSFVLDEDDLDKAVRATDSGEVLDVVEEHSDIPGTSEPSDKPNPARVSENISVSSEIDTGTEAPFMDRRVESETVRWYVLFWGKKPLSLETIPHERLLSTPPNMISCLKYVSNESILSNVDSEIRTGDLVLGRHLAMKELMNSSGRSFPWMMTIAQLDTTSWPI